MGLTVATGSHLWVNLMTQVSILNYTHRLISDSVGFKHLTPLNDNNNNKNILYKTWEIYWRVPPKKKIHGNKILKIPL
jgi:hypothetical protein